MLRLVRCLMLAIAGVPATASAHKLQRAAEVGGQRPVAVTGTSIVLYDQFDAASGNGTPDQDFETALDAFDAMAADDFAVPADAAWIVHEVRTIGSTSLAGGATVSVVVHENTIGGGAPDLPGGAVPGCSHSGITPTTDTAGSFVIHLPPTCLLTAGRYWLALQTRQDVATHGQHFWSTRGSQTGSVAVWRNPGNGFGSGCVVFRPQTQCGVGGGASPDLLFQIVGEPAGADLAVSISDSPDPVTAGQTVHYLAAMQNLGPAPARDVEMQFALEPGVAPLAADASAGGSCTLLSDSVLCRWTGLTAAGTAREASVEAQVPAESLQGSSVRADVVVSATSDDPDSENNAAVALTDVSTVADVSLSQAAAIPQKVIAGANLQLLATASNDGPSDARDLALAMALPEGLVLLSVEADGGQCATDGVLRCQWLGASPPGVRRQMRVLTRVRPSVPEGTLEVSIQASSATSDPATAGNDAIVSAMVQARADLSLILSASPDLVVAGEHWTIAADIVNAGPSDALDVRASLSLPPETSVARVDPGPGGSCLIAAHLECVWQGRSEPGTGRRLVTEFAVASSVIAGTRLDTLVRVSSPTADTDTSNNSATASSSVQTSADLEITLQTAPSILTVGSITELRAQARNLGASDAQDVEVEVFLGPDLRFAGVDSAGADCQVPQIGLSGMLRCRWSGPTTPQASRELRVGASAGGNGHAPVMALTSSLTPDSDATNNQAVSSIVIGADLREIPMLGIYGQLLLCLMLVWATVRQEKS